MSIQAPSTPSPSPAESPVDTKVDVQVEPAKVPAESKVETPLVPVPAEPKLVETEVLSEKIEQNEKDPADEVKNDLYNDAFKLNTTLKQQLEDYKKSNTNVFEENEILKTELAEQEKLVEMAKQNTEMKTQLDSIKRNAIVESLIATGGLTNDLKGWAEELRLDQLETFSKHAPKVKTILQETNAGSTSKTVEDLKKQQNQSRIVTR
jgi:hypothetical protein